MRGLGRVADDPDERVPAGDRERVLGCVVLDQPDEFLELVEAQVGESFLLGEGLLEGHTRHHTRSGLTWQSVHCGLGNTYNRMTGTGC